MELKNFFKNATCEDVKIGGVLSTEKYQNELSIAHGYFEVSMYLLDEVKNIRGTSDKKGDYWIYPIFSCVNSMIRYYLASILYQLSIIATGVKGQEDCNYLNIEDMFTAVLQESKIKLQKEEIESAMETLKPIQEYFALMKGHNQALSELPKFNSKEEYYVNAEQYQKWVDVINSRLEGYLGQLEQLNEAVEYI